MPRYELKELFRELESGSGPGKLWPVYWIHGPERMKVRQALERIERAAGVGQGRGSFGIEKLDASEVDAPEILDAVRSIAMGGGLKLVVVRDAHLISDTEPLAALFSKPAPADQLRQDGINVCVFISKDLDGRKKFSKALLDQAAVVPCEEVPEEERDAWVQSLARPYAEALGPLEQGVLDRLRTLEPWSLDGVQQELEKLSLSGGNPAVLMGGAPGAGADGFIDAFFKRDLKRALACIDVFAESPDEALPLLGLMAWNVRHLALVVADHQKGTRSVRLSPFLLDRLKSWARHWTLDELEAVQNKLAEIDFGIKQTPRHPLGIWGAFVTSSVA